MCSFKICMDLHQVVGFHPAPTGHAIMCETCAEFDPEDMYDTMNSDLIEYHSVVDSLKSCSVLNHHHRDMNPGAVWSVWLL